LIFNSRFPLDLEQNSEKLQEESKESLKTQSNLTNEQRTHNSFSENSSTSEVALSDESKLKATYQISDSSKNFILLY